MHDAWAQTERQEPLTGGSLLQAYLGQTQLEGLVLCPPPMLPDKPPARFHFQKDRAKRLQHATREVIGVHCKPMMASLPGWAMCLNSHVPNVPEVECLVK
jgi:hypothetical protein